MGMTVAPRSKETEHQKEKKRLLKELEHLEKAHKSGIVEEREYKDVKKSLEEKMEKVDERALQALAKENAVKEILGAENIAKETSPKPSRAKKTRHKKYFMKIEKPKVQKPKVVSPSLSKKGKDKEEEPAPKKLDKKAQKSDRKSKSVKKADKAVPTLVEDLKPIRKVRLVRRKKKVVVVKADSKEKASRIVLEKKQVKNQVDQKADQNPKDSLIKDVDEVAEQKPSTPQPSPFGQREKPQYIDDLMQDKETNWRFALAVLTIFLLVLLYVKFTGFGGAGAVVPVSVFLDYSSVHSHTLFDTLQELDGEYENQLTVEYYFLGSGIQNSLLTQGYACAKEQHAGYDFLSMAFASDWEDGTDLSVFALDLGLDQTVFDTCLSSESKGFLHTSTQEQATSFGVTHTPTLVINNKKVVGAVEPAMIRTVIDGELSLLG